MRLAFDGLVINQKWEQRLWYVMRVDEVKRRSRWYIGCFDNRETFTR